jgi:hypothetical protein
MSQYPRINSCVSTTTACVSTPRSCVSTAVPKPCDTLPWVCGRVYCVSPPVPDPSGDSVGSSAVLSAACMAAKWRCR